VRMFPLHPPKVSQLMMRELTTHINAKLADLCVEVAYEPMLYFSEADLQQLLVEKLRAIPQLGRIKNTSVDRGKKSKSKYKTSCIHREYGAGEGRRFDIVVFSLESIKGIDNANLQCGGKYLIPDFTFELGTEKTIDILSHFQSDVEKLEKTKTMGYLIHFYRDVTKAPADTIRRSNTDEKILEAYVHVFEYELAKIQVSNIRVLAVLLSSFRDQNKSWGKCAVFDVETKRFQKINIKNENNKLRLLVLKQLETKVI
jgi:hypothetical protein